MSTKKPNILIVDDERELVMMMTTRLKASDYEVSVAFDGEEGLREAKKVKPDLILLDVMMPGKDGYSMLLDLKKDNELCRIPVIVLTAKPGMKDLFELEGVQVYLTKPFEAKDLMAAISNILP